MTRYNKKIQPKVLIGSRKKVDNPVFSIAELISSHKVFRLL